MSQQELVERVISVLTQAGIDYMVTGSIASSIQGEPRSTHDIDIVVSLKPTDVLALLQAFPAPEFYLSEDSIRDALRTQTMFNLVGLHDGEKVDFWILTADPFDQSRFARKRQENILGFQLNITSPEDTILMKLRWCKLSGGSEKQYTDALRVFELQRPDLDFDYLNHWATTLQVDDLWQRIQSEASTAP